MYPFLTLVFFFSNELGKMLQVFWQDTLSLTHIRLRVTLPQLSPKELAGDRYVVCLNFNTAGLFLYCVYVMLF